VSVAADKKRHKATKSWVHVRTPKSTRLSKTGKVSILPLSTRIAYLYMDMLSRHWVAFFLISLLTYTRFISELTSLVDDVLGHNAGDKVPMEKVVMLLWAFRDDESVVTFMAQFVSKVRSRVDTGVVAVLLF
jgi:hypothetical protein